MAKNVKMEVKGDVLHIEVSLKEKGEVSTSGKSLIIGSTEGNATVKHGKRDVKVGLNVYVPNPAAPKSEKK